MTDIADLAETEETPTPDDNPLAPFDDNPLSPSLALIGEVYACQEWYVEEYRAVAADSDDHEGLMRSHFASWANRTTSGILGSGGGPAWDSFREYLSNPDLYPGGMEALRADAIHVEAVRRLKVRTAEAVRSAEKALQDLRNDDSSLRNREVCAHCSRKRDGLWERRNDMARRTDRAGLDERTLCDACVEKAISTHKVWISLPKKVSSSW